MLYNSSLTPGMDMANNAEEENCIFETDMTHLNCHHTQPFLWPFFRDHPGELVPEENFMVEGKINRGRHTDHPAGRHSIRCLPPLSPNFYKPDALPAAQPTVSKHWRQPSEPPDVGLYPFDFILRCCVFVWTRMPAGHPVVRRKCSGGTLRRRSSASFGNRRHGAVVRKVSQGTKNLYFGFSTPRSFDLVHEFSSEMGCRHMLQYRCFQHQQPFQPNPCS